MFLISENLRLQDVVFVKDIPVAKVQALLRQSYHDVQPFCPEYIQKCLDNKDNDIYYGAFRKNDPDNALAILTVSENNGPAPYIHEMTGFVRGAGRLLFNAVLKECGKAWGQIMLNQDKDGYCHGTNSKLLNEFYKKIPGLKFYSVSNSIWNCEATFFCYGISVEEFAKYCENNYSARTDESLSGPDSTKLRRDMKNGIVKFKYKKTKDGTTRVANGTLKKELMPKFDHEKPAKPNPVKFTYWDTDKKDFRSFKRKNFIGRASK